jgi:hypothetical protein
VKNDYGKEQEASALNELEEPLKKKIDGHHSLAAAVRLLSASPQMFWCERSCHPSCYTCLIFQNKRQGFRIGWCSGEAVDFILGNISIESRQG